MVACASKPDQESDPPSEPRAHFHLALLRPYGYRLPLLLLPLPLSAILIDTILFGCLSYF